MNALLAIGILCIVGVGSLQGSTIFSALPNSEGVFATVEITRDQARVLISTSSEFIGADISVESLLGDPVSVLLFQITDVPLVTLPSPPFTLGGIDYPGSPSRLIFDQDFTLTETQVAQFADVGTVDLLFSGGSLAEPVRLSLSSIPEPSSFSMLALAGVMAAFARRNRKPQNQAGEQVGALEAPTALRVL